jgi:DUF4097 and DUF4098 domain-containing protein YvlB
VRQETFSTPGPVTLDIRVPAGDVEIETDDVTETSVDLEVRGRDAGQREEEAEISMRQRGDGYEVRIEAGRGGGLFRRNGDYNVHVRAPHGATVRANFASADISGRGRYEELDVKVASGDVDFEEIAGDAGINTASGDVRLRRVGRPRVNSASGDVEIGEATDGAEINTASGDIDLRSVVSGDVRVNSASGDIEVGIAKGSRLLVDAQTLSGDASSELDLESGTGGGSDDGPLVELKARSMSGDISVKRA